MFSKFVDVSSIEKKTNLRIVRPSLLLNAILYCAQTNLQIKRDKIKLQPFKREIRPNFSGVSAPQHVCNTQNLKVFIFDSIILKGCSMKIFIDCGFQKCSMYRTQKKYLKQKNISHTGTLLVVDLVYT